MKIRGNTSAVRESPDRDHALLAAFLEATDRLDRRALQRSAPLSETPKAVNLEPVNLEANPTSFDASQTSLEMHPALLEAEPTSLEAHLTSTAPKARITPFIFRRANLVRA